MAETAVGAAIMAQVAATVAAMVDGAAMEAAWGTIGGAVAREKEIAQKEAAMANETAVEAVEWGTEEAAEGQAGKFQYSTL